MSCVDKSVQICVNASCGLVEEATYWRMYRPKIRLRVLINYLFCLTPLTSVTHHKNAIFSPKCLFIIWRLRKWPIFLYHFKCELACTSAKKKKYTDNIIIFRSLQRNNRNTFGSMQKLCRWNCYFLFWFGFYRPIDMLFHHSNWSALMHVCLFPYSFVLHKITIKRVKCKSSGEHQWDQLLSNSDMVHVDLILEICNALTIVAIHWRMLQFIRIHICM